MTTEQLGQQIKQKYPQYKDVPDGELGQKMLIKYPKYKGVVNTPKAPRKVESLLSGHPVLKNIVGFIGAEKLGTGIAQAIFLRFTPEGKELLKRVEKGQIKEDEMNRVLGGIVTPKQVAGSASQLGLNIATAGGAGIGGKLAPRIGKGAALGAGFGVSGAVQDDRDVKTGAIAGGVFGAGLPIAGEGVRRLLGQITEQLPRRLFQSAIGQPKKELVAGKDISEYALKTRKIGTSDKLIADAERAVVNLSSQVQKNFDISPKTVRVLNNEIFSEIVQKVNSEGGRASAPELRKVITSLAPQSKGLLGKSSFSLSEANRLRQSLDKTLGDRAFLTSQLPYNKSVLLSYTNALREKIKTLAPEGTRDLFSELSKEITLRNALIQNYAGKSRVKPITVFDLFIAGGGFAGGGLPGAAGSVALKKGLESAVVQTGVAVRLDQLRALAPILQKLTPAERILLFNTLGLSLPSDQDDIPQESEGLQ
jgi:hypothetical protein